MSRLTHIDNAGDTRMVDVSGKDITERIAIARGHVALDSALFDIIKCQSAKKGDVLSVAQLAGIMGAKQTSSLIPLCHPLPLLNVEVVLRPVDSPPRVEIEARVRTTGRTGVEMEALTAVSIAALTVYDMVKSAGHGMEIRNIRLVVKEGGKSGRFVREADDHH
ncbi:MAG: cyclic pyranopterin monophosphate synthase MoaC [Rhodobacteraceae bacterium]|nr:cyclic pyranopterin monophosphate synthase MoaC [Paracoccaceae bacterium]